MDHAKDIIIDVDGCLTDGKVYYTHIGERIKGFHSRDTRAFRELIAKGYAITLLTASSWPGMKYYALRCGVDIVVMRDKSEFRSEVPYICICDDIADIELARNAEQVFVPADGESSLLQSLPNKVSILKSKGGDGVMAELVKLIP